MSNFIFVTTWFFDHSCSADRKHNLNMTVSRPGNLSQSLHGDKYEMATSEKTVLLGCQMEMPGSFACACVHVCVFPFSVTWYSKANREGASLCEEDLLDCFLETSAYLYLAPGNVQSLSVGVNQGHVQYCTCTSSNWKYVKRLN